MTKYIYAGILFILAYSCNQNPKPTEHLLIKTENSTDSLTISAKTVITGKIKHPPNKFVILFTKSITDTVYLDNGNRFEINIYLKSSSYFRLSDGSKSIKIFIEPSKNIHIVYDANDIFNSIEFTGVGAKPNNYILDRYRLMLSQPIPLVQLYEYPIKEFRFIVDSLYVINKIRLDDFLTLNSDVSPIFEKIELATITYDRAAKLIEYLNVNSVIDDTKYLKIINKLTVNDSSLLGLYEYKLFLNGVITYYSNKDICNHNLMSYDITLLKMKSVVDNISNHKIIDYMIYTLLKDQVKYYGYKNTEKLFLVFDKECKDSEYRVLLQKPYYEYLALINAPKAPNIKMVSPHGEMYTLNNFKGDYIYIDVWATWCLPCRKQTPYFEALKREYSYKKIVFISISVDKKRDDWIEYLEINNLNKDQFIVDDIESFLDRYMIKTIPHFLIIDNKGNLIEAIANRPSDIDKEWLNNLPNK